MKPLQDKVVLITGAGRGIGEATAELCAKLGASLVLNDLGCDPSGAGADPGVIESTAASLREAGAQVATDVGDVCAPGHAEALSQLALDRFGQLDGVVACTGIQQRAKLAFVRDEDMQRVYQTSAAAPLALLRAAAERMSPERGGSVVLMAGSAAFRGQQRDLAHAMAHGAVVGLTRTAALELRPKRVRVNAIAATAHTRQTRELPLFRGANATRMTAAHIAPLVAYLLSDRSQAVSGELLGVAGSRFYGIRTRETEGFFGDDAPLSVEQVADAWDVALD